MAKNFRGVAQLVEHRSPKPGVVSSSLAAPAKSKTIGVVLIEPDMLLRDPLEPPVPAMIADGLGQKANKAYIAFLEGVEELGISLLDWKFYNDGKVWLMKGEYRWVSSRGTNKAKPIFWVSIWKGFFKVSFHFAHSVPEGILELPLSDEVMKLARGNGEIKGNVTWKSIIIDVAAKSQLSDVFAIAAFRRDN